MIATYLRQHENDLKGKIDFSIQVLMQRVKPS